jgi:WXG100 family type VII secretion target
MPRIRVNYDALRSAAAAVNTRSTTLKEIQTALAGRAAVLATSWDGLAEQSWFAQLQSCQTRIAKSPAMLDELSRDLFDSAQLIEKAESDSVALIVATIDIGG